jgi:hypothetical protein
MYYFIKSLVGVYSGLIIYSYGLTANQHYNKLDKIKL